MNSGRPAEPTPNRSDKQIAPGMEKVASFEVWYRQYLDIDGNLLCDLPASVADRDRARTMFGQMTLARLFDEKAIALQRTGRLGTYASLLGEEAIGAAVATAMTDQDVLLPSFREHGAQLQRGATVAELLLYWGGDERGSHYAQSNDFPNCVPIATHIPHAAGCALAFKLRNEPRVAVAICGDGATSKGDFYEALNVAGAWSLPLLTIVANNGWAISVPRSAQSRARTLAQKAFAVGIPTEQVDGNDALAMLAAVEQALVRIRRGDGPELIEALTYRLSDHTTADDASRYRSDQEVSEHWKADPLARMRKYLTQSGSWSVEDEQALIQRSRDQIQAGVDLYLSTPPQSISSAFDTLFESLPAALVSQREQAVESEAQHLPVPDDA